MNLNKFTIQKSFAINAGAGSGKTYTLSRRYINAVLGFDFFREKDFDDLFYDNLKPATPKQIVTITYTEAAALEMKERIFHLMSKVINYKNLKEDDGYKVSIEEAIKSLSDNQIKYVLDTLSKAIIQSSDSKISTIHSFCLDILKTNLDVAKFDSSIDILKDDEKDKIMNESIFEVLNNDINKTKIKDITKYLNLFFLNNIFKKYAISANFRSQFNSFDSNSLDERTLKFLILDLYKLPDVKDDLETLEIEFKEANLEPKFIEFLKKYIENFFNFNAVSWSQLSKELNVELQFNRKPFTQMKHIKEEVENIKSFEKYLSAYQPIDINKENLFYTKVELLKDIMNQIKSLYDIKIKELGKLDFDEIIQKTHEVIKQVKIDVKYMMVDEFQDTNSIQYDIIKNSLNKDSNLFVVGDSKQSIYSFQGAEIEVFNDAINDRNYISSVEPMDINYRSDGAVLNNVNKIFEKLLANNDEITLISQNYEATPQNLHVSKPQKEEIGTFKFLINSNDANDEEDDSNEYEQIAKFIANIKYGKLNEYSHITEKINNNETAIAVVFDSSTKMLELKSYLNSHDIECKVSASESYYHTKEINDIFNVLMNMQFPNDKFYKAGALRSNILRFSDNEIYDIIKNKKEVVELNELKQIFENSTLSEFILYVYEKYSFKYLQENFKDSEQKKANLDKFLFKVIENETINGDEKYNFLKQIEKNIYFSEAKEDEAFFKSDNLESIQLCTIHSTKGLAYPMVILANSDKNIYGQIQSDSIKHNNFTINENANIGFKKEEKLVTGFKVDAYEPLAFRLLKEVDKLKHLAEKKRLLYVALTRAEHDIVISGSIKKTKKNELSLPDTSYLALIAKGLDIDANKLYENDYEDCIDNLEDISIEKQVKSFENKEVTLKPLEFESKSKKISATNSEKSQETDATKLGTITHKIFEFYWDRLEDINISDIFDKFEVEEVKNQNKITSSIKKFMESDVYDKLKNGAEHRFELEFNYQDKTGFIDLIYFDESKNGWIIVDFKTGNKTIEKEQKYMKQLEFYEKALSDIGMIVVNKKILWL